MATTNQQIIDYTLVMKNYYVASYYQDLKVLSDKFGTRLAVIPQSVLLSYELRELRAVQMGVNKLLRQTAFEVLKKLRDELYLQQQAEYNAKKKVVS